MPSYKDKKTGKWYASFYYEKQTGQREKKIRILKSKIHRL